MKNEGVKCPISGGNFAMSGKGLKYFMNYFTFWENTF